MGVPPGRGGPFDSRWLSLVDLLANPGFFQVRLRVAVDACQSQKRWYQSSKGGGCVKVATVSE